MYGLDVYEAGVLGNADELERSFRKRRQGSIAGYEANKAVIFSTAVLDNDLEHRFPNSVGK